VASTGHRGNSGQYRSQGVWWPVQVTGVIVASTGHRGYGGQYRAQECMMASTGHRNGGSQHKSQEWRGPNQKKKKTTTTKKTQKTLVYTRTPRWPSERGEEGGEVREAWRGGSRGNVYRRRTY